MIFEIKEKFKKFFSGAKFSKDSRGSTLIELLLSLGVFSVLISISIAGFVQTLFNQRLLLKLMAATDNVSSAIEQMTREIRVGTNIETLPEGGSSVQFINPDGKIITYFLEVSNNQGRIVRKEEDEVGDPTPLIRPITADNVNVSYFQAQALDFGFGGPVRVVLNVGVRVSERKAKEIDTYLQTVVSSRAE
ncbi:MAG: prepilin-type N-terminal cleavage/methylation domain-containing protein [Patescibacteria group bacterium]|nr:prepilin-type N-terminal cleavage/methylation domain-containing protein [Patescibacteria group bacterium]